MLTGQQFYRDQMNTSPSVFETGSENKSQMMNDLS